LRRHAELKKTIMEERGMSKLVRILGRATACFVVSWLAGCGTLPQPVVGGTYGPPQTIVIEQIPQMRLGAFIGFEPHIPFAPSGDLHFAMPSSASPVGDHANTVNSAMLQQLTTGPRVPVSVGIAGGAVAGVLGAMIQASAEETQRNAMNFHEVVRERMPGTDLGDAFMKAIQASLEQHGIRVTTHPASNPPRVRWPIPNEGALKFETQPNDPPTVDADLYVQISPRAIYRAPGPLNAYQPLAIAVVVIYDGRTKQFLRKQLFVESKAGFKMEHHTYTGLLDSLSEAIPALHDTLMRLVPPVVDVISARELALK